MKKQSPRCENCGDETRFHGNSDGLRVKAGWCNNCYDRFRKIATEEQWQAWVKKINGDKPKMF